MINSSSGMKRLMDVSGVVEQQSHGSRQTVGLGMSLESVFLDRLVLKRTLVTISFVNPVSDGIDSLSDVVSIESEIVV